MALAIVAYFLLPGPPEKTKFLTERESAVATERLRIESAGLVSLEYRTQPNTSVAHPHV